ncbi:kinesin-like protein KIF6 [Carcharodon carcharias]|uniref:kinesin-like protein KIF6 n=1 Tax=Carcharodon carcharias TaxID=13397 RepID=UPI001B7ED85A|nr:kinesin-like protein KIF6 [Carcharodon carcharias]
MWEIVDATDVLDDHMCRKCHQLQNHQLKGQLEQRRMQRAACSVTSVPVDVTEPDHLEADLREKIEEEKKSYKMTFNRLKALKTEIEHLQHLLEKAKVMMQKDFEVWWSEEAARLQVQQEQLSKTICQSTCKTPSVTPTASQRSLHSSRICSTVNGFVPYKPLLVHKGLLVQTSDFFQLR